MIEPAVAVGVPVRATERWTARTVWITASLAFSVAVVALIQTTSIPLLPALPDAFDSNIASVSWVATSTLVVGAAINPIVGRMGDIYGKRLLVLGCLGVALAGTVLGATAQSLPVVVAGRAIQGIGAGVIPLAYGIVRDELPAPHLSRAVSVVSAVGAGLGAGLGPVAMGAVLTAHGWRAVFWLVAGLLVVAVATICASTRGGAVVRFPASFDWPGAAVLAASLVVLLLGITKGSTWGWTSSRVAVSIAIGLAMAAWWVRWERRRTEPLVDLAVSRSGPVLLAHLAGFMVGFATFAQFVSSFALVSLPAETGHGLGRTVAFAGLVQVPGAAALAVAVLVATRVSATRGSDALLRFGAAAIVAGFALAAFRHGSVFQVATSVTVVNVGIGASFCALPIMIVEHVDHAQTGAVNAVNALARVIGSVLASAIVTAVMATGAVAVARPSEHPAEWTFVAADVIGAVPAVGVGALAWRAGRRWARSEALPSYSS